MLQAGASSLPSSIPRRCSRRLTAASACSAPRFPCGSLPSIRAGIASCSWSTRTGIRALKDIKEKRYPLRVSVREDPTHSTLVLIDQAFALHEFTLKDIEAWGGRLVTCGGPFDDRRMTPLRGGELDGIFDEGIK